MEHLIGIVSKKQLQELVINQFDLDFMEHFTRLHQSNHLSERGIKMISNEILNGLTINLKHKVDIFQNEYLSDVKNLANIKKNIFGYQVIDYMNEHLDYKLTYKDLRNIQTGCCSVKILNDFRKARSNLRIGKHQTNLDILISKGFVVCSRCGGSGKHSYNRKTGDTCFKCNGVGAIKA